MSTLSSLLLGLGSLLLLGLGATPNDDDDAPAKILSDRGHQAATAGGWTYAVDPKPLSPQVNKGLAWLVSHQHEDGGWGQGEESTHMGSAGGGNPSNVGDTCAAGLALLRAGHTPSAGDYAGAVLAAARFVGQQVLSSDPQSLSVTSVQGTRLQSKLGPYVDTFLASMFLAEVKGAMPNERDEQLTVTALDTVIDKIERNQRKDGTWDDRGWAPVLSQSIAAKGLNRARQNGAQVDEDVLGRTEEYARDKMSGERLSVDGPGSAGVALYAAGSVVSTLQDTANSNAMREQELRADLEAAADPKQKAQLKQELDGLEELKTINAAARKAIVRNLGDESFVAGFGSNGGEEFLSYMNISESLVVEGGNEWQEWDGRMTDNLNRIQNNDGSWAGHHCITGRTFCTASALLVLMADRTPIPVQGQAEQGEVLSPGAPAADEEQLPADAPSDG